MPGRVQEVDQTGLGTEVMSDKETMPASSGHERDLTFVLWFANAAPDAATISKALGEEGEAFSRARGNEGASAEMEIVHDGFDIAVGTGAPVSAAARHAFGIAPDALVAAQAMTIAVAGPSNDDATPLAAIRSVTRAALAICETGQCLAVGWNPANSVMGTEYFARVAGDWLAGGSFPALGLASLAVQADGTMHSLGMASVCGQELVIASIAGLSDADRAKIAVRMINHMATGAAITQALTVEVDGFGAFEIRPDANGEKVYLNRSPFA